ncbi:MAG: adenylate/guanylate cyclase domain-containing protein [Betaproteobacteria bacterium]
MDPPGLKRRLTCILATDAAGYSRLVNEDETGALRVLAAHRAVIDGIIAFHDGRIANTAGDSVLAEFGSVVEAVRCAVEIQEALKTRNESLPEAQRMLFRIGINLGEVVVKGNDLLGDGVNVAARLQSIAEPGGILVASSVYDQITGKLDLGFQDMGEQALKNIARPIRAFSVSGAGGALRAPAPRLASTVSTARALPIAIGVLVIAAIAGGVAWTQGWIGTSRPAPSSFAAAPDPAKARLEADLAASEKARLQAEQRATTADASAIRSRAEVEAAALRAKVESEAATIRAKAQSEATALRAQAAQDAGRSKAADAEAIRARAEVEAAALKAKSEADAASLRAKAQSDVAAMQSKAAQDVKDAQDAAMAKAAQAAAAVKATQEAATAKAAQDAAAKAATPGVAVAAADASRYDGAWMMSMQCSANQFSPGFTRNTDLVVRGGEFMVERGARGVPGYNTIRGHPAPDGTLVLTGTGIGNQGRGHGQPFEIRLAGRWTGDRFVLNGGWGGRDCAVEATRR